MNQAIDREGVGVASKAIIDAVKNPSKVVIDEAKKSIKYIGKTAGVVPNDLGKFVTTRDRNSAGFRIIQ